MEFHSYKTKYEAARGLMSKKDRSEVNPTLYTEQVLKVLHFNSPYDELTTGGAIMQSWAERDWLLNKRPYYSVFPSIVAPLLKTPLSIDGIHIFLPTNPLLIRFPIGHELQVDYKNRRIEGILVQLIKGDGVPNQCNLFIKHSNEHEPWNSFAGASIAHGQTVEESLNDIITFTQERYSAVEAGFVNEIQMVARLVCSLCLLDSDPSIIKPDVLAEDRHRYDETSDQKYIDRARRQGKVGWLVGADLKISPHIRRPHFGLRWTGEGRTIPKIVPISGAVVHRTKLSDVPTGYLDNDEKSTT